MAQIGQFARTPDGYVGRVCTLNLDVKLRIVLAEPSEAENAPAYRILLGGEVHAPEVGAAWKHTGEKSGPYLSLVIDDPSFTQPIRANLVQSSRDEDTYLLLWSRPSSRRGTE